MLRAALPPTLSALPAMAAQRFGKRTALVTAEVELTFSDIEHRVAALAAGLADLGIQPGVRVVLHLPNSWEWIVAYYAVARVQAIVVPANILLAVAEVRFIAEDCTAAAIVAPADRIALLAEAPVPASVQHYIAVGRNTQPDAASFDTLLSSSPPLAHRAGAGAASDVSTIAYTSGTTGHPKGAALLHRAVILNTALTATLHVRTEADTIVTALPCSHVYGNVVMNATFLCGSGLILLPRFDPAKALAAIETYTATVFDGVPTMYYDLLGSEHLGRFRHDSLKRCTVGGQTMTLAQMQDVERLLRCPLLELWGMTEIAGLGTTHPAYAPGPLGTIGRPLPYMECRVADLDDATVTLADGAAGELMVRGPTVMRGYWENELATREVLREDGWLHTGDIACRDPHGCFAIVDRKKDMINTAGYKVYPSELERVIAQHPAVAMVAVAAVADDRKGEVAKAYVVCRTGVTCSEEELLAHSRQLLAAYKVPRSIAFVRELPKTSTGKILRRALHTLDALAERQ